MSGPVLIVLTYMESHDPTARIPWIEELAREGLLSETAQDSARRHIRPASAWHAWAQNLLLMLGATLVLAGVVFFFAYNWQAMGRFLKFGVIQAAIVACILVSLRFRDHALSGNIMLMAACMLTGVLLAVFGQTYQTGADAYELFFAWALLITGWVAVSQFAACWFLWLILLQTGTVLYWVQVAEPLHHTPFETLCIGIASINLLGLIAREIGSVMGFAWLKARWHRALLLMTLLSALFIPTFAIILDIDDSSATRLAAAILWLIGSAGAGFVYRKLLPDMAALSLVVTNACLMLIVLLGRIAFDQVHNMEAFIFLLMAVIILGVVSLATFYLRRASRAMHAEQPERAP